MPYKLQGNKMQFVINIYDPLCFKLILIEVEK